MGQVIKVLCRDCGHEFEANDGGGFFFHMLSCDKCGRNKAVSFKKIADLHKRYLKGLSGPYCAASEENDERVRMEYQGEPISEEEYHRKIEEIAGHCRCRGQYRFNAPLRCLKCRSENVELGEVTLCYD